MGNYWLDLHNKEIEEQKEILRQYQVLAGKVTEPNLNGDVYPKLVVDATIEKKKFRGKFQHAPDDLPKGRMYSAPFFESMIQKFEPRPSKRSLKEEISVGDMAEKALDEARTHLHDAMVIYQLTRGNK